MSRLGVGLITLFICCSFSLIYFFSRQDEPKQEAPQIKSERAALFTAMEKVVVEKRSKEGDAKAKLEREGWTFVAAEIPDSQLIALDPGALDGSDSKKREKQFITQLRSVSQSPENFDNIEKIALTTPNKELRNAAIEALGSSNYPQAQDKLISIFQNSEDEDTQSKILGYMKPTAPNDAVSDFLFSQIADGSKSNDMKEQASFPLIIMGTLYAAKSGRNGVDESVINRVPANWKDDFIRLTNAVNGRRTE